MLLGKRPRPPMKRTTSMSEITFDLNTPTPADSAPDPNHHDHGPSWWKHPQPPPDQSRVLATASPGSHRRQYSSADVEHFLRSCSLCKRPLVPGRDIYMYRGDSGFCSQECRQEQMKQDEKKDKFCVASKKQVQPPPPTTSASQVAT